MRMATWNVCTLYRGGAMSKFVKEMCKYKVDTSKCSAINYMAGEWKCNKELYDFI